MGRPRKEIDFQQLENLVKIGATQSEAAQFFGVSPDTIERRLREEFDLTFAEFFQIHSAEFKMSLRRLQMQSAMGEKKRTLVTDQSGQPVLDDQGRPTYIEEYLVKPSVSMQIFLGKNFLDQSDRNDITTRGEKIEGLHSLLDAWADDEPDHDTDEDQE